MIIAAYLIGFFVGAMTLAMVASLKLSGVIEIPYSVIAIFIATLIVGLLGIVVLEKVTEEATE